MNDEQMQEQRSGARDKQIRAALNQHWAASDANDFQTEHLLYYEDAVLDYPQSGEQPAVEAIYRANALANRAKSGLLSNE
jgi:ketosteroid isomerase-like protein